MFFPDALLTRSGALAHVWLISNFEKKMHKNEILRDRIVDDVKIIIDSNQSGIPLALRTNGQLLLGVSRIFKRKVGYLYEDCNEQLMKLRLVSRRKPPAQLLVTGAVVPICECQSGVI
jgi:cohesin complex subunit SCC1